MAVIRFFKWESWIWAYMYMQTDMRTYIHTCIHTYIHIIQTHHEYLHTYVKSFVYMWKSATDTLGIQKSNHMSASTLVRQFETRPAATLCMSTSKSIHTHTNEGIYGFTHVASHIVNTYVHTQYKQTHNTLVRIHKSDTNPHTLTQNTHAISDTWPQPRNLQCAYRSVAAQHSCCSISVPNWR